MSYNRTSIIGIIGKDAEVKEIKERKVLMFSVAVGNGRDAQGNYRPSTWFDVFYNYNDNMAWMLTALKAKTKVFVEGRVDANAYTDKQGNAVASLRISAFVIEPMDGASQVVTVQPHPAVTVPKSYVQPQSVVTDAAAESDLPF